jgi:hypothetical protein
MKWRAFGLALASTVLFAGCPGDGGNSTPFNGTGPRLIGFIQVPNFTAATVASFDLATVDPATGLYYVTDRNNASIDVINSANDTLVAQFKPGFTGCRNAALAVVPGCAAGVVTANSGPNGVDLVNAAGGNPAALYATDANAIFALNRATGAVIKKIVVNGLGACAAPCVGGPPVLAGAAMSNLRVDEGCFDPVHNIYAGSSTNESPPFITFTNTATLNVIATVYMQAGGLEACLYDAATDKFFFNSAGSAVNGRGEIVGIPGATINAAKAAETATWPGGTQWTLGARFAATNPSPAVALPFPPAGVVVQGLGNCDPTGLVTGPGTDIASMCRQGNVGELFTFQIYNKTALGGAALATLNIGGGDQIWYDAPTDQYLLADSRWTPTGLSCGAGSAGCPLTPILALVNGTARTIAARIPAGGGAHTVASINGKAYMMYSSGTAVIGGINYDQQNTGGIALYSLR